MVPIWLIRILPRRLAVWLGLRKLTPGKVRPWDAHVYDVPGDTGGAWRPDYRMQDPSRDPKEPYGTESSSRGNDHGWSNCTMDAGALAFAYHVHDKSGPYAGDMRHHQDDQEGGTDLYDLEQAWARYGDQDLKIKTGQGWSKVKQYHSEGHAIVIQGEGNVPGDATFTGGHACMIAPETHSDGRWLWADPLATGWQWVDPDKIRDWAEEWHSGIAFAISKSVTPEPPEPEPPEPEPEPEPIKPPTIANAIAWAPAISPAVHWDSATWDGTDWYIPPAEWHTGWAVPVPKWNETKWIGEWV